MSITASLKDSSVIEGSSTQLNVSGVKENASMRYESDDPEVATVDQSGKVIAVKKGETGIKVTADATQNYEEASVTVPITVLGNITDKSKTVISLADGPFVYDNTEKKPDETVRYMDSELTKGTDYSVSYNNNKNAGTASITVTGMGGYGGEQVIEFSIDRKAVKVTADDKTREYGTIDPELTYTSDGLAEGDSDSSVFTGSLTRDPGRIPGTYAIRQGSLTANDNYEVEFVEGTFTITSGKNATITVKNEGVKDSSIKDVVEKGLDEYAEGLSDDENASIEIEMIAEPQEESDLQTSVARTLINAVSKALSSLTNDRLEVKCEFLELFIIKHEYDSQTQNETEEEVSELPDAVESAVAFDMSGKTNITVARDHEGTVEVFDRLDSRPAGNFRDGTFYADSGHVYIYSSRYSTFAIAYTMEKKAEATANEEKLPVNDGGNSTSNNTNTEDKDGKDSKDSSSSVNNTRSNDGSLYRSSSSNKSNSGREPIISRIANYLFGSSYEDDDSSDSSSDKDTKSKVAGSGASKAIYSIIGKKSVRYESAKIGKKTDNVVIPDKVKIGKKTYAVTSVASDAFYGEDNIKTVSVGANVKKLEEGAFSGAKKLKKLIIKSKKLTKNKVKGCLKGSKVKKIKVPADKADAYKSIFTRKNAGKQVKVKVAK